MEGSTKWYWWSVPLVCAIIALFFVSGGMSAGSAFVQVFAWGALVYPIVWLDRRLPVSSSRLAARFVWHIPLSLAWTVVYLLLYGSASALLGTATMLSPSLPEAIGEGAIQWNLPNYWLIVGTHLVLDYAAQSRAREARAGRLEQLLMKSELSTLRAQLQPHFLFNALNLISAEVERHPARARQMLEHLGELLRASLHETAQDESTVQEETDLLDHYLSIQRARFAGRLEIEVSLDPGTREARVPSLLLQPLVENAMHHGLAQTLRPGRLRITSRTSGGRLHLTVEDDGVGLPQGWSADQAMGTGLTNTRQRLQARYGVDHHLDVAPGPERGVVVSIDLPLDLTRRVERRVPA